MRCLSKRLVPKSVADARNRSLIAPPDAGVGVDASSEIGTCDGQTAGGSGGGSPSGLTAADYKKLYNLPTTAIGAGKVIAIVDACSNPGVLTDLAAYRSQFGLGTLNECGGADGHAPTPGDTTACIGVVGQRGDANLGPSDSGWSTEISLDVEMASTACPECSILLVEADSPNSWDLGPAVSEAVALGASAVSNSYGAPEDPNDPFGSGYSDGPYAAYYQHPGTLIAVASGDDLYNNQSLASQDGNVLAPSFPSTVGTVLSVGGTQTTTSSGTRGYTEAVWNQGGGGTTSGCSTETARPSYQASLSTGTCTMRADVDVSAAAAGIAMYVGGWTPVGGTSAASPFVASLLTRVGLANRTNDFLYEHASDGFYDVTTGNNDPSRSCTGIMCTAGAGWDGPTGWGTPNGMALVTIGEIDGGVAVAPPPDAGSAADDAGSSSGGTASSSGATGSSGSSSGSSGGFGGGSSSGGTSGTSSGTSSSGGSEDAGSSGGNGGGGGSSSSSGCTLAMIGDAQGAPVSVGLLALGWTLALVRRRRRD
jgi:subtilase family serine protease